MSKRVIVCRVDEDLYDQFNEYIKERKVTKQSVFVDALINHIGYEKYMTPYMREKLS